MSRRPAPLLALVVVLAAGCSLSNGGSAGPVRAVSGFTCCTARDINRVYHPGDVVTIHWIIDTTQAAAPARPASVTLTAALDGGFATAADAKSGRTAGTRQVRAEPVRVTDGTTVAPLSRLRIPDDATPGLYNLTTTTATGGITMSGTSIIRVE